MTKKKDRCVFAVERNGKEVRCSLEEGHAGDHEAQDGDGEEQAKPMRLKVPVPPKHAYAYLMGAVDYALGLGLDRLAIELGAPRKKGESDSDLSKRVREKAKLR